MKILLVYPEFPDTFWSLKYAVRFISKKSAYPPLGLLTVAAMLPENWQKKLIDMNVQRLSNRHLKWANLVFISAMSLQYESVKRIVKRCKNMGARIIAGGPLFTESPENFEDIDFLVLNEAEVTLPQFLECFLKGNPRHIYTSQESADLESAPLPLWELIDIRKYSSINIQYSRGCPLNCESCEIKSLYGKKARLKSAKRIADELESLYSAGWRGSVFFAGDNFDKEVLKNDILPAIIAWSKEKSSPFSFHIKASINIADDDKLLRVMRAAGFTTVFIDIRTPCCDSLSEYSRNQNRYVDNIQKHGLFVQGEILLGLGNDSDNIFDMLIKFIQSSGIVVAMVGLLNVRGTELFKKLKKENIVASYGTENNTDVSMNCLSRMDFNKLAEGYKKVINAIYSPQNYYRRVKDYLNKYADNKHCGAIEAKGMTAFVKSIFTLGIWCKERYCYWELILGTLLKRPSLVPTAVSFALYGYHFHKIYKI